MTHFQSLIRGMKERKKNAILTVQKYLRGYKEYQKYEKILLKGKLSKIIMNQNSSRKYLSKSEIL